MNRSVNRVILDRSSNIKTRLFKTKRQPASARKKIYRQRSYRHGSVSVFLRSINHDTPFKATLS